MPEGTLHHLSMIDWFVITVYALGVMVVGWYYSRKSKTGDDYLLGGRKMSPSAIGLSLFATVVSTISFVAKPGETVRWGPMMASQILAYPFIVWIVGRFIIPAIMQVRIVSAYELLESRLGGNIRTLASSMFLLLRLLWMAYILFATVEIVLIPVTGLEPESSPWVCIVIALITIAYTSLGGFKAVIWTDVIQTVILMGGAILTLVTITISMGGIGEWWPHSWAENWQEVKWGFDTTSRLTMGWALLSAICWFICVNGSDQMAIQRFVASGSVHAARRVFAVSMIADALVTVLLTMIGFSLLAYFTSNPNLMPLETDIVRNADQLFPLYIVSGLPLGVSGLVIAGLVAAAMSSLSSGLNSCCSVITVDFIERWRGKPHKDSEQVWLARIVSMGVGACVILISAYVDRVPGNLLETGYRVVNLLIAPLFVLFFMALFLQNATAIGAWVAVSSSIISAVTISYSEVFFSGLRISFLWILPGSLVVGISVAILITIILGKNRTEKG